jgi:hypothetical protein
LAKYLRTSLKGYQQWRTIHPANPVFGCQSWSRACGIRVQVFLELVALKNKKKKKKNKKDKKEDT